MNIVSFYKCMEVVRTYYHNLDDDDDDSIGKCKHDVKVCNEDSDKMCNSFER